MYNNIYVRMGYIITYTRMKYYYYYTAIYWSTAMINLVEINN